MHVIADPADGVLRRGPFAENRVNVPVDDAGQHGVALGVDRPVSLHIGRRVQFGDTIPLDQQRGHVADRVGKLAREELADIGDQCPRHFPLPVPVL